MNELRIILLGIAIPTIAGVWWSMQRRNRETHDLREVRPTDRQEPRLLANPAFEDTGEIRYEDDETFEVGPRHLADARIDPGVPPPVITIDDLPEDVEEVELADYSDPLEQTVIDRYPDAPHARTATRLPVVEAPVVSAAVAAPDPVPDPELPAGPVEPAPVARAVEKPRSYRSQSSATREATSAAEAAIEQRIVAIRMAAGRAPVAGRALLASLQAEGLEYGRYAIFHRQRDDGRILYSVASLLEPGSFDVDLMGTQTFPGVSLFAVFPGPVDAELVFDDMLATARRLSDRLGGALQDERGQILSAQRVLALREELVHFQSMVANIRARSTG